ncbi:DUF1891 domain-containing protein, partial [Klebsiella pneumoniae]|nr:DUF1891 domain-containing protein [Klebsiella pneumoniae]
LSIRLQELSSIQLTSRHLSNYCKLYFILLLIGLNEKKKEKKYRHRKYFLRILKKNSLTL